MARERNDDGASRDARDSAEPGTARPAELPHSIEEALSSLDRRAPATVARSAAFEQALTSLERLVPETVPAATASGERRLGLAVVASPGDRFLQVDPGVTEITGFTREELHQLTLADISYASDLDDDDDGSPSLFVAGELPLYTSERRLVRKDGGLRWVRLHKTVLHDLEGLPATAAPVGILVVEDMPGVRPSAAPLPDERVTEATTVSEAAPDDPASEALEAMPDGFALFEVLPGDRGAPADCRALQVNAPFGRLTGLALRAGATLQEAQVGPEGAWVLETCARVLRGGKPLRFASSARDETRSVEVVAYAVRPGRVALVAVDATDRRRAARLLERGQAELRAVLKRVIERAEAERASVAAVLHDNVVKRLDALAGTLEPAGAGAAQEARFADARRQALGLTESVHALLSRLRPPHLDELGLLAALRAYGERYSLSTSVSVIVDGHEPEPRLGLQREIAIFRIVEEALASVVAHDGATRAHVRIESRDERILLTVADDGIGVVPERESQAEQGLVAMREVAVAAGGLLRVEPAPGHGTQIIVDLPHG
jgi:PAS domain S-box-containing protein